MGTEKSIRRSNGRANAPLVSRRLVVAGAIAILSSLWSGRSLADAIDASDANAAEGSTLTYTAFYTAGGDKRSIEFERSIPQVLASLDSHAYDPTLSYMLAAVSAAAYSKECIVLTLRGLGFDDAEAHYCRFISNFLQSSPISARCSTSPARLWPCAMYGRNRASARDWRGSPHRCSAAATKDVRPAMNAPYRYNCRYRFTSSMAPVAHSKPLLPTFAPARSMACSKFSVVMTPNITGTPLLSDVWATPLATSLQTSS